jgi:integrase
MAENKKRVVRNTRRGNGDGSIYELKSGLWCGKLTYKDEDGSAKRKSFYGQSKTEVSKKMTEFSGRMEGYNNDSMRTKNMSELLEDWLMVFKKPTVTSRTFENNLRIFKKHIKPYIGNMKLDEVDSNVIQRLLNQQLAKQYSLLYVKKIKFVLNQFFEYCIDNKIVEVNPSLRTKVKSRDQKMSDREKIYKAMPMEVRIEFMEKLNQHPFLKALCMTGMFAGMRIGEMLALRWKNIDLENKLINVEYGITQITKFDDKGNIVKRITVIGDTKTACSIREVPVPDILVEVLKEWRKHQWVEGQLKGQDLIADTSIVFCNEDGRLRSYYGTRCIFDRFKIKHKLEKYNIHFHTLRHTYSTMLFESGENPKIIQALLGHKSVNTTLMVYNNVDKTYFREATERLNKMFDKKHMEAYIAFQEKPKEKIIEDKQKENENLFENTDQEIVMLEKMLEQRRQEVKQKKKQDFDM